MWKRLKVLLGFTRNRILLQDLRDLTKIFAYLDAFERDGAIHWMPKDNALLIEERLALPELARGRQSFLNFLNQVSLWQNNRIIQEAYERHRIQVETAAVRKAQERTPGLTKDDLVRIREFARETMQPLPIESLNCVKEFDLMIIRQHGIMEEATEENGMLLAVGHFDGKQVELALFDDVKYNLFRS